MPSKFERAREAALIKDAATQAHEMALVELEAEGITDPHSPAGKEFLGRVFNFGIMGAQPPRPELNDGQPGLTGMSTSENISARRS